MTNTASPSSFYNGNAVVYTDTNPAGPADTPVSSNSTPAASSFYKGTGTSNAPLAYLTGIPSFSPIASNWLTGISQTGVWTYAQPSFTDILGTLSAAQMPPGFSPTTPFANPTSLVGLAAINGVATTAMRSDAAPALNLAIAPTWTGLHTFSKPTAITDTTTSTSSTTGALVVSGGVGANGNINSGGNVGIPFTGQFTIGGAVKLWAQQAQVNLWFGQSAGNTSVTGTVNVGIGGGALFKLTTGSNNLAIGVSALQNLTTGTSNTALGVNTLFNCVSGISNVAIGGNALDACVSGSYNMAIGGFALQSSQADIGNTGLGYGALFTLNGGSQNTAIGFESLFNATLATQCVAIGTSALAGNLTGNNNVAIGYQAGANVTGSQNTLIGLQCGSGITSGSFNTVVGVVALGNISNCVVLGDGNANVRYDYNYTNANAHTLSGGPLFTLAHTAAGAILSNTVAGVGYATGAGGTVTQATSKSTGVTLSKASGQITMNAAALAAATIVSFVLTNTSIAATDTLVLNHVSGGTPGSYTLNAQCAAGSATINVRNNTAGSLSEAIVIAFTLIKGVTS